MTKAVVGNPVALVAGSVFERAQPWMVVFFAATFFFFEFMQINMFNALGHYFFIAYRLHDNTQLGHLAANYMYANVLFLFPAGIILDRVSTRRVIIGAMFACVTCTLIFAFTTQLWQGEACRFVTGIGGAFCLLSCIRLASRWFPPKKMALVVGLVVTMAMAGALVAQTPFTDMARAFGWRHTLIADSLVGYVMLALIALWVRDFPSSDRGFVEQQHKTLSSMGVLKTIGSSLKNMQNWMAGIYASLINLPVFILGTWGAMYLFQIHHINRQDATHITTMMYLGLIIGCPVFGWISDRLQNRRQPMIYGALLCLLMVAPLILCPTLNYDELMMVFFGIGLAVSSQIISYAVVAESNSAELTGASEGVASVLIMAGGFLIPVFAQLLDVYWNHRLVGHLPVYSLKSFDFAFMLMPVGFVLALLAAFAIKETNCKSLVERTDNAS